MDVSTFEERRRARADWQIRQVKLDEEPLTDDRLAEDPDARLAMVARLTAEQWALSGQALPRYARHEMPGCVRRRGHAR